MRKRLFVPSLAFDRLTVGSPWQPATWVLWIVSRLILFGNVVLLHHPCDYVFWLYGHRMIALHQVPYRDFPVEYPPLASLLFMIPGGARDYATYAAGFAVVMAAADLATVVLVHAAAVRLGLWRDGWRAAFFYTLLSYMSAGAVWSKFDLLPGTLTLVAVLLLVQGRERSAWIALAAAVLFKGYAVVLAPIFLLYRYRVRGRAGWWNGPLAGAGATALVVAPFYLQAGLRLVQGPLYHARRGLEIESIYASVVLLAHHLFGLPVVVTARAVVISRDVFSPLNGPLLALLPWVLGSALTATYAVAWVRLRRAPSAEALLLLSMAAVAAFTLAFKALPTHYLLWLCPLATVALGRAASRTVLVTAALWLAIVFGAIVPIMWDELRQLDPLATGVMVGRNLSIVALFVLLLVRAWPRRTTNDRRQAAGAAAAR